MEHLAKIKKKCKLPKNKVSTYNSNTDIIEVMDDRILKQIADLNTHYIRPSNIQGADLEV
jgi:hypothetical protein